jgi:hypothetical protein
VIRCQQNFEKTLLLPPRWLAALRYHHHHRHAPLKYTYTSRPARVQGNFRSAKSSAQNWFLGGFDDGGVSSMLARDSGFTALGGAQNQMSQLRLDVIGLPALTADLTLSRWW